MKAAVWIGIAILVVVLTVLAVIRKDPVIPAISLASSEDIGDYASSYETYLIENGYDGSLAGEEIEVDLSGYKTEGELVAETGEAGLCTSGDGTVTWDFTAPESGFYNLCLSYVALPGTTSDIQREIRIDGEIPYDYLSRVVIRRKWSDFPIREKRGNELRPDSYEVYEETDWFVEDADRRAVDPLMIYLSKGKHSISFYTIKEPMEFTGISFKAKEKAKPYGDMISGLKAEYSEYSGGNLVYQAERAGDGVEAVFKSATDISVQKNYSDSLIVPYHAYHSRYNTIGGGSWKNPGDTVTWRINVPVEGLYEIAFKGRQSTNRGVTSYRRFTVNGEVPCLEAQAVGFGYSSAMNYYTLSDGKGEAITVHLTSGVNELSLEDVMGPFGGIITEVEESLKVLNSTYLKVVQLTGQSPSKFIDYQVDKKIPEFRANMKSESERLEAIVDRIIEITGEKGENTALLEKMATEAKNLSEDPEHVIEELPQLKNNISAVGTWIVRVSEMPLELDSILLKAPGTKLPDATDGFFAGVVNGTLRFFASFIYSTNSVGESEGLSKPLTVWVASYGKEQAQIIQNLVDNSFTPDTDIGVSIQLIPADVVLRAALAGNGPDVVIGLGQSTVQDFAMRDATLDLSKLEGYSEVSSVFPASAIRTASYLDGVYGLPETANFLMMFYREDILKELDAEVPVTWTDFIELLPTLQQSNYSAFIPNAYLNDGSGNLNFYLAMVEQYGGNAYTGSGSSYGVSSGLSSNEAMEAFKDYTDFYTNYGLDKQMDFSNRFRTGEVPIGIANYTTFCQLEIFAPEIKGVWNFAPIPGTEKEDEVDNTVFVDTADTVIMKQTDTPEEAWRFLKWWMSTRTQLDYCQTVESVMGTAARVASANREVINQLPWSNSELKAILSQLEHSDGLCAVPGYYMTNRMISYAFSNVVSNNMNPRESLYLNVESINKELTRKREELGLK